MYVEGEEEIMQLHVRVTVLGKSSTCIEKPKRQICSTKFVGFVLVCLSSPHNRQICSASFWWGGGGQKEPRTQPSLDHKTTAALHAVLYCCGPVAAGERSAPRFLNTLRAHLSKVRHVTRHTCFI